MYCVITEICDPQSLTFQIWMACEDIIKKEGKKIQKKESMKWLHQNS